MDGTTWAEVGRVALAAFVGLTAIILLTRVNGLRSFAKMSSNDFPVTLAIGSTLAAIAARTVDLLPGLVALAALYLFQRLYQVVRLVSDTGEEALENSPLLLMAGDQVLWGNLRRGGITVSELRAKLREANVVRYDQVFAVVLETTGDISVLHGDPNEGQLDPDLLAGVSGVPEPDHWPVEWRPEDAIRGPAGHGPASERP